MVEAGGALQQGRYVPKGKSGNVNMFHSSVMMLIKCSEEFLLSVAVSHIIVHYY